MAKGWACWRGPRCRARSSMCSSRGLDPVPPTSHLITSLPPTSYLYNSYIPQVCGPAERARSYLLPPTSYHLYLHLYLYNSYILQVRGPAERARSYLLPPTSYHLYLHLYLYNSYILQVRGPAERARSGPGAQEAHTVGHSWGSNPGLAGVAPLLSRPSPLLLLALPSRSPVFLVGSTVASDLTS